jgi:ribosome-binding protein aMBF1 (putative translation factor)
VSLRVVPTRVTLNYNRIVPAESAIRPVAAGLSADPRRAEAMAKKKRIDKVDQLIGDQLSELDCRLDKVKSHIKEHHRGKAATALTKDGIGDQLIAAIKASGISQNQLAKATGVLQTSISFFLRGQDMGIHRAAKIADYLGLELVSKKNGKRSRTSKKRGRNS